MPRPPAVRRSRSLCWHVPLVEGLGNPQRISDGLHKFQDLCRNGSVPVLPGLYPLVIDDSVVMRTSRTLWAIDFNTGKRLWEMPLGEVGRGNRDYETRETQYVPAAIQNVFRAWLDSAYGMLSSDGRYVFSVEDEARPGLGMDSSIRNGFHRGLAAYDLQTKGKLLWHIGGGQGPNALQPGMTFLGPPLPLHGQLFVLVEVAGEIRLLALEAKTGGLLWEQSLAAVDREAVKSVDRRLFGLSPSYADGILVCPTGGGAVVSVDLGSQSLLWGYRYGRVKFARRGGGRRGARVVVWGGPAAAFGNDPMFNVLQTIRWFDATATIADGRVVITPIEADSLYCLNLADGTLAWDPLPREDDLYVANIYRGKIILVGRHGVHAVRLDNGHPAWDGRIVEFPTHNTLPGLPIRAIPSGRGYASDNRYYVPLNSSEIMAVDLDEGKLVEVSKSAEGFVPGNLVCHRGKVISQGWDGVEVFRQTDTLREEIGRLKSHPDDAEALRLLGESRLEEGKLAEAVQILRKSLQLESHDLRTRYLLRDALLKRAPRRLRHV